MKVVLRVGWIKGQRGMDWLDSLLSTNAVVLAWLVDEELVFEAKNGFGQDGNAREGAVMLNIVVNAATISASSTAGNRMSLSSRRESGFFTEGRLRDRFENGARVPFEISSISQKLKAAAADPRMKLLYMINMDNLISEWISIHLALSKPRTHALPFTGSPAES